MASSSTGDAVLHTVDGPMAQEDGKGSTTGKHLLNASTQSTTFRKNGENHDVSNVTPHQIYVEEIHLPFALLHSSLELFSYKFLNIILRHLQNVYRSGNELLLPQR
jgi:hypothetical protein